MVYDFIKSHKREGFTLSPEDTFFEKPQGGIFPSIPFETVKSNRGKRNKKA